MSFGRACNPTLGQRKSPWAERQELQKNREEKQLPPRASPIHGLPERSPLPTTPADPLDLNICL